MRQQAASSGNESDHFNKRISKLRSQGSNDHRDYLTRSVKNTDQLETTFAVDRDRGEQKEGGLQFTHECSQHSQDALNALSRVLLP
jgi:hypothetical protein